MPKKEAVKNKILIMTIGIIRTLKALIQCL